MNTTTRFALSNYQPEVSLPSGEYFVDTFVRIKGKIVVDSNNNITSNLVLTESVNSIADEANQILKDLGIES